MLRFSLFLCIFSCLSTIMAQPKWFRLTYRDDPSTTISIGWSGITGTVYYDTINHGANFSQYAMSSPVVRNVNHRGNDHRFVRLTNLQPGTVYYFLVQYNVSATSDVYSFMTLSDDPNVPLSFISGGDSRKDLNILGVGDPPCWGNGCRETRRDLNTIVAKTRPDFVAFTGDYIRNNDIPFTSINPEADWIDWFDDWELSIGADNRLIPIIHSLGNHEDDVDLDKLFDVENIQAYYATNFSGNLLRLYTLNSEPSDACADVIQKNWFLNDLQQHSTPSNSPTWKIVQYHQPMIPHAGYTSRTDMINCWASAFEQYNVRLVCESHAHVMKTTYPLVYDASASNSYNGLVRNDSTGAVFIGDGSWGAPPRPAYSPIANLTEDVEQTSGFFFVHLNQERIKIQGIIPYPDSIVGIPALTDNDQGTELQSGIPLWRPSGSPHCIIIPNYDNTSTRTLPNKSTYLSKVYPNPADDFLILEIDQEKQMNARVEIYDARGKWCRTYSDLDKATIELDLRDFCSGVNFINVITKNDVECHKVLIKK